MTEQVHEITDAPKKSRLSDKQKKIGVLGAAAVGVAVLGLLVNDRLSKKNDPSLELVVDETPES